MAISDEGNRFAYATVDGHLLVRGPEDRDLFATTGEGLPVALAFAADASRLAAIPASFDYGIWDIEDGRRVLDPSSVQRRLR